MTRNHRLRLRRFSTPAHASLAKARPAIVPTLAKRLRRVVDHRTLELILQQSEQDAGID